MSPYQDDETPHRLFGPYGTRIPTGKGHPVVSNSLDSESTGTATSIASVDAALAREIVAAAIDRYLKATRARIVPFVDDHFSWSGACSLHRYAVGWDLVRAPINVALAVPQVTVLIGAGVARSAGWQRAADWLGSRQLFLTTDVAREIDWLIHAELLRLPYRQGARETSLDALTDAVFSDPRIESVTRTVLEDAGQRMTDAQFRRDLEDKLAVYTGSRSAATDLTQAMVSVAVGATAFKQLTPGVVSLGPAVATAAAQQAAIAGFPLGAGLGSLWYGVFPASPSPLMTVGVTLGLALGFSVLSAFAGVVADPVQRALGIHQRRLRRLVAAIERNLGGDGPERFVVRDHYVARILDVADVLRAAWSKLH